MSGHVYRFFKIIVLTTVVLKLVLEGCRELSGAERRSRSGTVIAGENLGGYEAPPLVVLIVRLRTKVRQMNNENRQVSLGELFGFGFGWVGGEKHGE